MNRVGFCLGFVVLTLVATVEVYGLPEFVYLNRGWSSIDCRESDDPLTASYGGVDECFTGSASISAYVSLDDDRWLLQTTYTDSPSCNMTGTSANSLLSANLSTSGCFAPANQAGPIHSQRVTVINSTTLNIIGLTKYSSPDCDAATSVVSGPSYSLFTPYGCDIASNPTRKVFVRNRRLVICSFNSSAGACNPRLASMSCVEYENGACYNSSTATDQWMVYRFNVIDSIDPHATHPISSSSTGPFVNTSGSSTASCATDISLCSLSGVTPNRWIGTRHWIVVLVWTAVALLLLLPVV